MSRLEAPLSRKRVICAVHGADKFQSPSGCWECTQCNTEFHRRRREQWRLGNGFDRRVGTRERERVETDALCAKHGCRKRRGVDGSLKCHICERQQIAERKAERKEREREARAAEVCRQEEARWERAFAQHADPHYYDGGKHERAWKSAVITPRRPPE